MQSALSFRTSSSFRVPITGACSRSMASSSSRSVSAAFRDCSAPTQRPQPQQHLPHLCSLFPELTLFSFPSLFAGDEFSYQEMITHLPLFAHAAPESVLIIGAGDGGVLREVCRHRSVRRVAMVEIDRQVVEASKTFFAKTMATDFEDPRLTLRFEDAAKFVADCEASAFDVVIVDSSDPNDGPASVLFTADFYSNLARVLKPGGIVCTQVSSRTRVGTGAVLPRSASAADAGSCSDSSERLSRLQHRDSAYAIEVTT